MATEQRHGLNRRRRVDTAVDACVSGASGAHRLVVRVGRAMGSVRVCVDGLCRTTRNCMDEETPGWCVYRQALDRVFLHHHEASTTR